MKNSKMPRPPTAADLNRGSATMLRSLLPGVGEVLATRITEHRVSYGPFSGPSDLARVPGIGEKRASRLWASLVADGLLPPDPTISDMSIRPTDPAPRLVLASDAPPSWFEEPDAVAETPLPHDAERVAPRRAASRSRFGFIALAVCGVCAVAIGTFALAESIRVRTTEAAHADMNGVRDEVRSSQAAIDEVRAAQIGADTRAQHQYDAIMKRLDDGDRRADDAARSRALIERRARKIEETQLALASKVGQVEDGLLWQKLVSAARGQKTKDSPPAAVSR